MKKMLAWGLIFFTAILIFAPTFITAIHGDEWKALWLARQALVDHGNYMPIRQSDTPYVFEHATLEILSRFFSLHSGAFYIFHFLVRAITAVYLYFFVNSITKNKTASYIATFLFMISPVGVEAYIWMRNFSSYIGMIILMHAYLFYIKESFKPLRIIALFVVALLVNTTRSHGVLLFFVGMLTFESIIENKYRYIVLAIMMIMVFLLFSQTSYFGGQAGKLLNDFQTRAFALNFTGNISKSFIMYPKYIRVSYIAFISLIFAWKIKTKKRFILAALTLLTLITFLYSFSLSTMAYLSSLFAISTISILATFCIYEYVSHDYKELRNTLLIIGLMVSWLVIPMIRQPLVVMGNDHRYLIYSAIVVPIVASLAYKSSKITIIPICFFSFIFASQTYQLINLHKFSHSTGYNNYVWRDISNQMTKDMYENVDTIILVSDTNQSSQVNASVYFGGMYHFALLYDYYGPEERLKELYFVGNSDDMKSLIQQHSNSIVIYFSTPKATL